MESAEGHKKFEGSSMQDDHETSSANQGQDEDMLSDHPIEKIHSALGWQEDDTPIDLDWRSRWLTGEEYCHILNNMDTYQEKYGWLIFEQKKHPDCIYTAPIDGLVYFVRGQTIGSDFGFPRLGTKKIYKWKKMNFTTDLPKKNPLVSYIVASAVKCKKFFPGSQKLGPAFRMHAVILKRRGCSAKILA